MKTFFIGLLLFLTGALAHAQDLYLDSSLKNKVDSAQFSKDSWYWTQLITDKDSEFIEIKGWGQVIAYTASDTL